MGGLVAGVVAAIAVLLTAQFRATPYDNFVLLAQALLHGRVDIDFPGAYIDALKYGDKYYIIEAPMPAILLVPAVAIFGGMTNQSTLAALLAGVATGATWELATRLGTPVAARILLCSFFMLGTDLMWCATFGDVWFTAHVASVAFTMLALMELAGPRRGWLVALFAACAVESRFTMVVALPFYAAMLWFDRVAPVPSPAPRRRPPLWESPAWRWFWSRFSVFPIETGERAAPEPVEVRTASEAAIGSDASRDGGATSGSDVATIAEGGASHAADRSVAVASADEPAATGDRSTADDAAAETPAVPAIATRTRAQRLRAIGGFAATLAPFVVLWVAYNYARWGTPYDIGYTAWYHQDAAGEPDGSPFRLSYLSMQLQSFFVQFPDRRPDYPYLVPGYGGVALTYTSPALLAAFAARGPWRTIGVLWLLTLAAAVPNFVYYVNGYAQFGMRHALDFEPFLIALMALAFRNRIATRVAIVPVLYSMLAGAWGIWYWKTIYHH